jgi:uncharacterized protein
MSSVLSIPDQKCLASFCERWLIKELSLFGSALTLNFSCDSDIDVLVTFRPEATWSLLDLVRAEDELAELMGKSVDLVEKLAVEQSENWIRRRSILASTKTIYAC